MDSSNYIEDVKEKDPTWSDAYSIVRKQIDIPTHVSRLFRGGWAGEADASEYMKVVGFAKLNPRCLLLAAEIDRSSVASGSEALSKSIFTLGVRLSAVILAINYSTKSVLRSKPPVGWRSVLEELITTVEIGYKFGSKTSSVGIEAGALIGFAQVAAKAILMARFPKEYKRYLAIERENKSVSAAEEIELFSCEMYQITAALLQQLGFGPSISLGTAFGMLPADLGEAIAEPELRNWQAASRWIRALKLGRNYPADVRLRNHFPEIKPTTGKERNLNLEVLHTEISKVRRDSSKWLWHLPCSSYEEVKEQFGLP